MLKNFIPLPFKNEYICMKYQRCAIHVTDKFCNSKNQRPGLLQTLAVTAYFKILYSILKYATHL